MWVFLPLHAWTHLWGCFLWWQIVVHPHHSVYLFCCLCFSDCLTPSASPLPPLCAMLTFFHNKLLRVCERSDLSLTSHNKGSHHLCSVTETNGRRTKSGGAVSKGNRMHLNCCLYNFSPKNWLKIFWKDHKWKTWMCTCRHRQKFRFINASTHTHIDTHLG